MDILIPMYLGSVVVNPKKNTHVVVAIIPHFEEIFYLFFNKYDLIHKYINSLEILMLHY
jgi:predicted nucleic acid-binding OB-fold protein